MLGVVKHGVQFEPVYPGSTDALHFLEVQEALDTFTDASEKQTITPV